MPAGRGPRATLGGGSGALGSAPCPSPLRPPTSYPQADSLAAAAQHSVVCELASAVPRGGSAAVGGGLLRLRLLAALREAVAVAGAEVPGGPALLALPAPPGAALAAAAAAAGPPGRCRVSLLLPGPAAEADAAWAAAAGLRPDGVGAEAAGLHVSCGGWGGVGDGLEPLRALRVAALGAAGRPALQAQALVAAAAAARREGCTAAGLAAIEVGPRLETRHRTRQRHL